MSWSHLSLSWVINESSGLFGLEIHEIEPLVKPLLPSNWEFAEIEVNAKDDYAIRFYIHDRIKEEDLLQVSNRLAVINKKQQQIFTDEEIVDNPTSHDITKDCDYDLTQAERILLFGTKDDAVLMQICEYLNIKYVKRNLSTVDCIILWRSWLPEKMLAKLNEHEAAQHLINEKLLEENK